MNCQLPSLAVSAVAAAAAASIYAGVRQYKTPEVHKTDPAFWGLYIDSAGRVIISHQAKQAPVTSRHRLIWDRTTQSVSIVTWDANVSVESIFNIWQRIDDEPVLVNALSALKPIFASQNVEAQRCTLIFLRPYSLTDKQTYLFTSALASTGIAGRVSPFALHSAVINCLGLPLNSGDLSSIAIILPDGNSVIAFPEECTNELARRKMAGRETTVAALTSNMRNIEQIILLENEFIAPSDETPLIIRESLDIVALGASLWAMRLEGGAPFHGSLAPEISILVLDSDRNRVVHPVLLRTLEKTGQVIVTTIADGQTTVEVNILYEKKPFTSLVLCGIPAAVAGGVDIIFSVAVVSRGNDELGTTFQLVELKSGIRVSKRASLWGTSDTMAEGPIQIAISKNQSPIRPISSDWDLVCLPDIPPVLVA